MWNKKPCPPLKNYPSIYRFQINGQIPYFRIYQCFKFNKFLSQDLPQFLAQEDPKNKKGSKNNLKTFIYK